MYAASCPYFLHLVAERGVARAERPNRAGGARELHRRRREERVERRQREPAAGTSLSTARDRSSMRIPCPACMRL